ncbi:Uncharacterised protein [Mycobacteroides abscessus subsp. abscessus]|nr:Uncharacterised protein [Mycobacteroides abscessus subsp. abscessus]
MALVSTSSSVPSKPSSALALSLLGLGTGDLDDLGVAFAGAFAVVAEHQVGELAGHHLVAAHQHVEHSLGADDL